MKICFAFSSTGFCKIDFTTVNTHEEEPSWIKNLLAEICLFNAPKYKTLLSQARSSGFQYHGFS